VFLARSELRINPPCGLLPGWCGNTDKPPCHETPEFSLLHGAGDGENHVGNFGYPISGVSQTPADFLPPWLSAGGLEHPQRSHSCIPETTLQKRRKPAAILVRGHVFTALTRHDCAWNNGRLSLRRWEPRRRRKARRE
jgi:hypothetical protein